MARTALERATAALVALLRSVERPNRHAVGEWTTTDVAVHLSHAFTLLPNLATGDSLPPLERLGGLARLTTTLVEEDAARDLDAIAAVIDAGCSVFLAATEGLEPSAETRWLVKGAKGSVLLLTAHLLHEALIHGYDVAVAEGVPWTIDPADAALVFDCFTVPVIQMLDPGELVDAAAAAGVDLRCDLRLRGGGRYVLAFADGALTIGHPDDLPVDCHVSADPTTFLLVGLGRQSKWRPLLAGGLVAWGRRPWRALLLPDLIRPP